MILTSRRVVVQRCPAVPTQAKTTARLTISRSASSFTRNQRTAMRFRNTYIATLETSVTTSGCMIKDSRKISAKKLRNTAYFEKIMKNTAKTRHQSTTYFLLQHIHDRLTAFFG